jgi:hypothetical protein
MSKLLAMGLLLPIGLSGCAGLAFRGQGVAMGFIYADAVTPIHATDNNIGRKTGEACATSILGLITTGDATIRAAADAGGVRDISAVDASIMQVLGIYAKHCTLVSGTG